MPPYLAGLARWAAAAAVNMCLGKADLPAGTRSRGRPLGGAHHTELPLHSLAVSVHALLQFVSVPQTSLQDSTIVLCRRVLVAKQRKICPTSPTPSCPRPPNMAPLCRDTCRMIVSFKHWHPGADICPNAAGADTPRHCGKACAARGAHTPQLGNGSCIVAMPFRNPRALRAGNGLVHLRRSSLTQYCSYISLQTWWHACRGQQAHWYHCQPPLACRPRRQPYQCTGAT